jgi:hypothetical protein
MADKQEADGGTERNREGRVCLEAEAGWLRGVCWCMSKRWIAEGQLRASRATTWGLVADDG